MKSGWSTIASIVVLAAIAGFVAGYCVTLARAPSVLPSDWAAVPSGNVPAGPAEIVELPADEFPTSTDSEFVDELKFFPETVLADAEIQAPERSATTPPGEPGALPVPSSTASPLPAAAAQRAGLEELIASEFGGLSDEQREVWLDVLEGLPLKDAAGILRLWKQFGRGTNDTAAPGVLGENLHRLNPRPIDPPAFAPQDNSLLPDIQQARKLLLQNLLNAETHGFRKYEPLFVDTVSEGDRTPSALHELTALTKMTPQSLGVAFCGWRIDQRAGTILDTGNSMDVAISGAGFFIVRDDKATVYTRCGRFRIDDERRIVLDLDDRHAVLQPELIVPADADEILIDSKGSVQVVRSSREPEAIGELKLAVFRDPSRLQPVGGTLFEATEASGPASVRPPYSDQTGWLKQRALETSNVSRDEELERLEWLDRLSAEIVASTRAQQ